MNLPRVESAARPAGRPPWLQPRQWRLWLQGLVGSRYDGLHHFAVVQPGVLLRCGQPRPRDLAQVQARHGLRTIVCARGGTRHPLRGRWFRRERRWCEGAGVLLEHMPFSDHAAPPDGLFDRFLTLVRDPQRHPILVHCEQGFHRTGVLCAAYRIAECGWPLDRAVDEMIRLGFEVHREKRRALFDAFMRWAETRAPGAAVETGD